MALPMKVLLEPVAAGALEDQHASKAPLLDYIYRVSVRNERDLLCPGVWGCLSQTLLGTGAFLASCGNSLVLAVGAELIRMRSYLCKMLRRSEMYHRQDGEERRVKCLK